MSDRDPATGWITDPGRMIKLDAFGGSENYAAAVAVAPDGTETMLMFHHPSNGGPVPPCRVPHEEVGPLPSGVRYKIANALTRCGARRNDGGRCRTAVRALGDRCAHHRDQTGPRPRGTSTQEGNHP